MTYQQLSLKPRIWQKNKRRASAFGGGPHRKGVIYKIAIMSPRKPNSAKRTFAKVRLNFNGKRLLTYTHLSFKNLFFQIYYGKSSNILQLIHQHSMFQR